MENEALDSNGTTAPADVQVLAQSGEAGSKGSAGFVALVPKAGTAAAPDVEKNLVFSSLVRGDGDITGLVAYSIYKQNKLDWLQAFEAAKSRAPDEAEVSAYIIGESTARRLATYRHLAEATLAGNGPEIDGSGMAPRWDKKPGKGGMSGTLLAVLGTAAILAVVGLWLAAHYTLTAR
ncbi:MAG: hypothetical protein ABSA13_16175 [Beijerinckiaceae bacterium]|jgi:hypothetical protein